jgi:hypothetical protein
MGAVTLAATLHLNWRKERYESLFAGDGWATGYEKDALPLAEHGERVKGFTDAFEAAVLQQLNLPGKRLSEVKRIAMLLRMMDGEYLLPEGEVRTQDLRNEFRQRRVLPDPSAWIADAGKLLEPEPTEEPWVSDDPKPSVPRGVSSGGMGNSLALPAPPQPTQPAVPKPARETVKLAGNINFAKRRAQVEIDGVEIPCEGMPSTPYGAPGIGETIQAMVTRDANGRPVSARCIRE